jgi:hypothetical protein
MKPWTISSDCTEVTTLPVARAILAQSVGLVSAERRRYVQHDLVAMASAMEIPTPFRSVSYAG